MAQVLQQMYATFLFNKLVLFKSDALEIKLQDPLASLPLSLSRGNLYTGEGYDTACAL